MDSLDWSLLSEDEGLQALRQFLDVGPTESVGGESLSVPQSKDATASVVMPKVASGEASPPEITPSPPSSGETSPEATSHKRKNDEAVKPAEGAPTTKTRRGSNDSDDDAAAKANGNGKTTDRRKEQNRNAQRAFRERKEKRMQELEGQVSDLARKQELTVNENSNLRDLVARLKAENTRLSAFEQAFTFNVATSGANLPATAQIRAEPSPLTQAKEQTDSGAEFAALVRSVQQHLGNAATHSFGPAFGSSAPSRPEGTFARQPSTSSGGSVGSPFELLRSGSSDNGISRAVKSTTPSSSAGPENPTASIRGADNFTGPASSSAVSKPSPNGSGTDPWASLSRSHGGDLVGDLTFLNDWDTSSMSLLNDPSSAGAIAPGSSASQPFATPPAEIGALGAEQSSTPWWSEASSWAMTGSAGDLGAGSFGSSDASAPSSGLAPAASFVVDPTSTLALTESAPPSQDVAECGGISDGEFSSFVASGFVTEGELDGLCDLMKAKATCKEKTALLEQVGRHKPNLAPAVELLKARRREEMERTMSLAGGV